MASDACALKNVLILDDEPADAELMVRALTAASTKAQGAAR